MKSYTFGPVPSRRLGRSLGVDLVPFKTCTYDCIYCQVGRTTLSSMERKEWVPLEDVVDQVRGKLSTKPDYITLSGSGEPTLYSRLGELIARIKEITEVPVAVLTNGSLLWDPAVRAELMGADLVVPSLDAGDERMFRYVNRPADGLSFEKMVEGLLAFGKEYQGRIWLEVFILGANAAVRDVEKIAEIARRINPERIQLNTVTRPPAEDFASPVPAERMSRFAELFGPQAEVVADYSKVHSQEQFVCRAQDVLELLRRRSCTPDDIATGLGMHRNEVAKYITELTEQGKLSCDMYSGKLYYQATGDDNREE